MRSHSKWAATLLFERELTHLLLKIKLKDYSSRYINGKTQCVIRWFIPGLYWTMRSRIWFFYRKIYKDCDLATFCIILIVNFWYFYQSFIKRICARNNLRLFCLLDQLFFIFKTTLNSDSFLNYQLHIENNYFKNSNKV